MAKAKTPVPLTVQDINNTLKALQGAENRGAFKDKEKIVVDQLMIKLQAFVMAHEPKDKDD